MDTIGASGIYLWESYNSFDTAAITWSGYVASEQCRIYADDRNVYVLGQHAGFEDRQIRAITRLDLTNYPYSVNSYHPEYDVGYTMTYPGVLMTHYIDDLGQSLYSVVHDALPSGVTGTEQFRYQSYPEVKDAWNTVSGGGRAVDLVFPDILDNPRFLLGLAEAASDKVLVVLAASGLTIRYATDWSAMVSGSAVTDLEVARIL